MPLVRLIAEGVGPFEKLDLDFSDGNGKPHLGPHILAGVNGSGKSTVLRTIAWLLDRGERGFQYVEWWHMLMGHPHSRAVAVFRPKRADPYCLACTVGAGGEIEKKLVDWPRSVAPPMRMEECLPYVNESWSTSRSLLPFSSRALYYNLAFFKCRGESIQHPL